MTARLYTTRTASIVMAVLVVSLGRTFPTYAQDPPATAEHAAVAKPQEPSVLKKIIAAHWRLANARPALPPVQVVYEEKLETQDWVEYAYDGGALRLYVSPGARGGDIFAILVDTRKPQYKDFTQLVCTERYTAYHHGSYTAVVPLRPASQTLFETLKSRRWTERELRQKLGSPSYKWLVHGIGWRGITYVAQGLSFVGQGSIPPPPVVRYQVHDLDAEAEWRKEHDDDLEIPPVSSLSQIDYDVVQQSCRNQFLSVVSQREEIDQALANGKRSPDGRFVVGTVNFGGVDYSTELVIRETGKPERRYRPQFQWLGEYLWLNTRTIVLQGNDSSMETEDFYALDASTGTANLVRRALVNSDSGRVVGFGVSGPQQFWYTTQDGQKHEVTVPSVKSVAK